MSQATFEPILEQYSQYLSHLGRSQNTIKSYTHDLTCFATWYAQTTGQALEPKAVIPEDIHDYRAYMQTVHQPNLAASTINRRLIALNRFFQWAESRDLIQENPFAAMETFTLRVQQGTAPPFLSHNEQKALLRAVRKAEDVRDLAIVQTLLGTGVRISELVNLKLENVELSERKGWLHVRGKGRKERDIPLGRNTRNALSNYLAEREKHTEAQVTDQVFLGERGPLTVYGIREVVYKYFYQARLEGYTVHDLRHTYAHNRTREGMPLEQVATLLGHESLDTTRIYTQPTNRDLERAISKAAFT